MPHLTNAPSEPIRWSLQRASKEFQISTTALVAKLNDAQEFAGEDFCFATSQIMTAIYGSLFEERHAKLKAEREKVQLETSILKADYLPRIELERVFAKRFGISCSRTRLNWPKRSFRLSKRHT
jgi:hypothetical protein